MRSDAGRVMIWDFDGTLGYREGMWSGALAEIHRKSRPGLAPGAEVFRPHLQAGFPWHEWQKIREPCSSAGEWWEAIYPVFERAFAKEGFTPEEAESAAREVRGVYLRPDAWSLFPDVVPFLEGRSGGTGTHVILSNHVPELEEILEQLGIRRHFDAVFNSSRTGIEKPHPEAFLQVTRAYPRARDFMMIGDSYAADIGGSEAVGIPGILLRKDDPRARRCCGSLEDLERIWGEAGA